MTILEGIRANPVFSDFQLNHIQSILVSRSVDGTADFSENIKEMELVTADLYMDIATLPEFKEGQLALKYNTDILLNRAKALYEKHSDSRASEFEPKVINVGITAVDV